ncbi:TetR/AcrR family transcriptional regulator [Labrys sp. La1]|uniref:TetR/AcrR family transcriptional regulator n=1 Tax=Labrys sp. La1 TaxID=3404917 RepID=UPI003EBF49A5
MAARGRPRAFDRSAALERAMQVFWAKGYEATQLADLTAAMGINPPSFYAAFDSKEAIFREAVDLYLATAGSGSMRILADTASTREAIAAMLLASIDIALASPSQGGCMVSLGLINCQEQNAAVRMHMRGLRKTTEDLIHQRLERGRAEGDLSSAADIGRLSRFFAAILQALSLQAQDGASRQDLAGIAEASLAALDLASARPDRPISRP